ncbi:2-amino-4-hydroxy-6-hydroxymethyldihydropteridine diphosphokinase [Solitalea sp. MAHUQ-68]|uniref:2-amino-4-hydroxy-6-hydroxymethyldihydropteridine pyrophosphokinase n=1 Tax=Solitalea agri TaxID=2953739 RepID=A0A9X2EZL5_9SPHI|nr:2-amino-4-hydroxy-6-hydroxymethyldihydropteridine diphosphokinase [Solitalea agri]MCO4291405.1 2-amino-4-hydroxy-6-hydroxymethyldihydropteridine diphosphokinase [Solitalea agri]
MNDLYVLLGGNLGNREENLANAISMLREKVGTIEDLSFTYETAAWGKTDQPDFLNQAVKIKPYKTEPINILTDILQIELDLGRQRIEHWGARVIDIDILLLGDEIVNSQRLTIPHPQLQHRKFALIPLNDIASDVVHPVLKKTISELLVLCIDSLEVRRKE